MTVLRDLLAASLDGEWGHGEPGADTVAMSVIRGTDFGDVRVGNVKSVPVRFLESRHAVRKELRAFDIVFETAGGSRDRPTGRSLLLTPSRLAKFDRPVACASFARFLRISPLKADPTFVFWLLQDLYNRRELLRFHTQHTGVARFQFTTFADTYHLQLPPVHVQRRIASILSAYDNLIEVNTRRIAILEEMGRRLFAQWFIKFCFPGHLTTKFTDRGKGRVPDSWSQGTLGDLIDLRYGKALKAADRIPGAFPVYGSSGIVGWHSQALVNGPGVIVGRKGNVGAVHWSQTAFFPIDTVFYVSTSWPLSFILYTLRAQTFLNSDSAVPGLNRAQALRMPTLIPPISLATQFDQHAIEHLKFSATVSNINDTLRAERDLLLPKLISGDVDIAGAERAVDRIAKQAAAE